MIYFPGFLKLKLCCIYWKIFPYLACNLTFFFQVHRQEPAVVDLSCCQEGFTQVERETDTDSCSFSTPAAVVGAQA